MRYFTTLFWILVLVNSAFGLKCYSCTLALNEGEDDSTEACVNDPGSVIGKNIITCPSRMKFCTIIRNDFKKTGRVSSMERNCAEDPIYIDEDIDGPDLLSHYRACQTDLCNSGNGLDHIYNEGEQGGGAFLMPGSGASLLLPSILFITIVVIFFSTALHE